MPMSLLTFPHIARYLKQLVPQSTVIVENLIHGFT